MLFVAAAGAGVFFAAIRVLFLSSLSVDDEDEEDDTFRFDFGGGMMQIFQGRIIIISNS